MHSFLEVERRSSGLTSHESELSPSTFGFPWRDLALTSGADAVAARVSAPAFGALLLILWPVPDTSPFPSLPSPEGEMGGKEREREKRERGEKRG